MFIVVNVKSNGGLLNHDVDGMPFGIIIVSMLFSGLGRSDRVIREDV